ncbi:MAG TPA: methyltransferase domain-containing protein [Verrucomicrobiae bacterium]
MTNSELQRYFSTHVTACGDRGIGNGSRKLLKMVGTFQERARILDVGCAEGCILKSLTGLHDVYGVDTSEPLARVARENGFKDVKIADLEGGAIPFEDESFDLVVSADTLEHIVDTDWIMCEINRVLKPGHRLLLCLPNIRTPVSIIAMLLGRAPMWAARYRASHVRDFTGRSMRAMCEDSGFRVLRQVGTDFCYSPNPEGILPGLASFLPSWSSRVITEAVKVKPAKYEVHEWC